VSIIVVPNDFPTIQEAVITSMPGDLIHVKKGTYHESVDVIGKNNIAIIAETGAILDGQKQLPYGFRIGQANGRGSFGIEVKGFLIKNYKEYGIRDDYSSRTYIMKNTIMKIGIDGILVEDSGHGDIHLIWKNKIKKIKKIGININAIIDPVSVIENRIIKTGDYGIHTLGSLGIIYRNTIKSTKNDGISVIASPVLKNYISHSKKNGVAILGSSVLVSQNYSGYNNGNGLKIIGTTGYIEENRLHYNSQDGINVNQNNHFIVRNLVNDNEANGIKIISSQNDVFANFACSNGDVDIDADGGNNSFLSNQVCDASVGDDEHIIIDDDE
jgi:hypothetical protein